MRNTILRLATTGLALVAALCVAGPLAAQTSDAMAMAKGPHGSFAGANRHEASGRFDIVTAGGRQVLRLSPDFKLDDAPDAYVVLSSSTALDGTYLYLGRLRNLTGASEFAIPAGTDLAAFKHVVLWCKKFKVTLGSAPLATSDQKR